MNRAIMIAAAALLALTACEEKKTDPKLEDPASKNPTTTGATTPITTTTAATPVAAPVPVPVTIAEADLSTPADFEDSAEKSITKANYKAQLTTLEADIAKE